MSTTTELKPCPFCGSKASIQNQFGHTYWAQCDNLDCGATDGTEHMTPAEASAFWNRRSAAHGEPSKAGEWNAAIEAAAEICRSMQCRPEFEPEFHDKMLKQAEERIRALLSVAPAQAAQSFRHRHVHHEREGEAMTPLDANQLCTVLNKLPLAEFKKVLLVEELNRTFTRSQRWKFCQEQYALEHTWIVVKENCDGH